MRKAVIRKIWVIVAVILVVALTSSGWVYTIVKDTNDAATQEQAILTASFNQQYGTDGITVKQMVSSSKVYTAIWTSKDGVTHMSWNISGLWVTVYNSPPPVPVSTPTPSP